MEGGKGSKKHHRNPISSSASTSKVKKNKKNHQSSPNPTTNKAAAEAAVVATGNDRDNGTTAHGEKHMPVANIIRIMRSILPPHAKIADEAKGTTQHCVSEFISLITGEANEKCRLEKRKTINGDDILWAMGKLGFDDYVEPLSAYLSRYRAVESRKPLPLPVHVGETVTGHPSPMVPAQPAPPSPMFTVNPMVYSLAMSLGFPIRLPPGYTVGSSSGAAIPFPEFDPYCFGPCCNHFK